jgi:hypothetical protein
MSRRLPTAALLAALILPCLAGCGPSAATTGKGGAATHQTSPTGKSAESGKDSAKTATHHHDPG